MNQGDAIVPSLAVIPQHCWLPVTVMLAAGAAANCQLHNSSTLVVPNSKEQQLVSCWALVRPTLPYQAM
jgi:hypothetical protein